VHVVEIDDEELYVLDDVLEKASSVRFGLRKKLKLIGNINE
jgi:hypothetical protein